MLKYRNIKSCIPKVEVISVTCLVEEVFHLIDFEPFFDLSQ